jgi:hypothetical protein
MVGTQHAQPRTATQHMTARHVYVYTGAGFARRDGIDGDNSNRGASVSEPPQGEPTAAAKRNDNEGG